MQGLISRSDFMIKLTVKIPVYPTELEASIQKIFEHFNPAEDFVSSISKSEENGLKIMSMTMQGIESLTFLFRHSRRQRIVEAVRRYTLELMDLNHNQCLLLLNKQALFQKKITVCSEASDSPLGPVQVQIESYNIERLVDYLFPHTKMGKVIEVDYIPE